MKRFSFPKKKRLVSNKQFEAILAHNVRVSDGLLTLYIAQNNCGFSRLGVSVSSSCGGAVVRNRLKRLMREAFRQSQDRIPVGFDYLLMISHPRRFASQKPGIGETKKKDKAARCDAVAPRRKSNGQTIKLPTFEQIRASFLALVNIAKTRIYER